MQVRLAPRKRRVVLNIGCDYLADCVADLVPRALGSWRQRCHSLLLVRLLSFDVSESLAIRRIHCLDDCGIRRCRLFARINLVNGSIFIVLPAILLGCGFDLDPTLARRGSLLKISVLT